MAAAMRINASPTRVPKSMRFTVGTVSSSTPATVKTQPIANSLAAYIGIFSGDQFVRRKVRVSNRKDRPAAKSAYPTHLLGGIAILGLDSTQNPQVPRPFRA